MRGYKVVAVALSAIWLSGCASQWYRGDIRDAEAKRRQLVVDKGYCEAAAHGSVPMPQIAYSGSNSGSAQFRMSGQSFNARSGTTFGNYSGTVTSTPSAAESFTQGMMGGAALGSALAARKAQKAAFRACMYAKGWSDEPLPESSLPSADRPLDTARFTVADIQVYESRRARWKDEGQELIRIFPVYQTSDQARAAFSEQARRVARQRPNASNLTIMLAAHDNLVDMGVIQPARPTPLSRLYRRAIGGDADAQAELGLGYSTGEYGLSIDHQRSLSWSRMAGRQGHPGGLFGCGLYLFWGKGIAVDRVHGYQLVAQAGKRGAKAEDVLRRFEQRMSQKELRAARDGY